MSLGKASIRRAASAGTRSPRAKAAGADVLADAVISPVNAEEIQVKFLSGNAAGQEENKKGPVHITEKLPDYLL